MSDNTVAFQQQRDSQTMGIGQENIARRAAAQAGGKVMMNTGKITISLNEFNMCSCISLKFNIYIRGH
ncbi:uncharacterized protein EI90DRAFT_3065980 [Cantharellus anzutake]|uniref:uncharacterized protein n=1 Tax=Cantharellus anzutake TaxID=1750568 RepID=UPI001906AEB6|nr:uncharacterized protein EI90DRAFT_3065980 [Cantharellus anzutake]KAF8328248.1 hypothetical protein EI90DRAFT_3065980 [Cantharellus anzutake]